MSKDYNFNCAQCGRCCRQPVEWTYEELQKLVTNDRAKSIMSKMKFIYFAEAKIFIEAKFEPFLNTPELSDQQCSFLGDDNRCTIHGDHPSACREYSNVEFAMICGSIYGCEMYNQFIKSSR